MLVFAHRGASAHYPENTLAAIQAALDVNADGIEIDIYEVEDELVVIHDRWLHRTTTGKGRLDQHSFSYIRSLDAGNGEKIPTLNEVLKLINGQCIINIELKNINNLSLLYNSLTKAIVEYNFSIQQLLISSFNHPLLHKIKKQNPQYSIGAVIACCPLKYAHFAQQLKAYSIHVDKECINEILVNDAHQRNLKVFVYTVDMPEDVVQLINLGVNGLFANDPKKMKNVIKALQDKT